MISRWKKGFMYLTAIIDVYSRFNVGQGGQFKVLKNKIK
jgi:hypothetical protein